LSNFMRFDFGGAKKHPIFDGYFGQSYFSAYFIKLASDGESCVIAYRTT
jgi:hypothetical protein